MELNLKTSLVIDDNFGVESDNGKWYILESFDNEDDG